jgi:cysteine synthase A
MTLFANILETVGNTPVVKIGKLAPPNVELYVKIEAFNPLGSVKDRLARGGVEDALRRGELGGCSVGRGAGGLPPPPPPR